MAHILTLCRHGADWAVRDATGEHYGQSPDIDETIQAAHFQRLWELAHDREQMPGGYEIWHASALDVMNTWLARGRALQIVTIRSDEFLPRRAERQLPNTAATRLKFVEDKARGGRRRHRRGRC